MQSWHVSVQREICRRLLVDVAYVGNTSRDILLFANYNQARRTAPTENATLQARRPIQGFADITYAFNGGKSRYHALQVKFEWRYSRGLYLLNSFTWSRAKDNGSGHLEVQNNDNSRASGLSATSRRTSAARATTSRSTTPPASCGSCRSARPPLRLDMNAVLERLLGGWRLVGINTMTSGGDRSTCRDRRRVGHSQDSAAARTPTART